jgi:hypothetical protein
LIGEPRAVEVDPSETGEVRTVDEYRYNTSAVLSVPKCIHSGQLLESGGRITVSLEPASEDLRLSNPLHVGPRLLIERAGV